MTFSLVNLLDAVIFNANDLTVLSTGLFALIIAIVLALQSTPGYNLRNLVLSAFFFQTTLISIGILIYWNINLNAWLSSRSANYFFTLGFTPFLQGPLLYWYTRMASRRDFRPRRRDLWHLLPALLYPCYMTLIYFRHDEAYKLQLVHSWTAVQDNPFFLAMIWAQNLALPAYNIACLLELRNFTARYGQAGADGESSIVWLKGVVAGFLALDAWHIAILLMARTSLGHWGYAMGTLENYFKALMLGGLLAYLLRHTVGFSDIAIEENQPHEAWPELPTGAQAGSHPEVRPENQPEARDLHLVKLHELMLTEKPYLQPNINLERLALRLEMSPKLLSSVINKKLNQNFFEMIRNYRLDEARNRLSDTGYRQQSINEIMQECGFNSKSVFNQWFKEKFGITPSQFRKQHPGYTDQAC